MIDMEDIPITEEEYFAMVKTINRLRTEKQHLIDKACDWLKHYLDCYVEVEGEHAFTTDLKIHTDLIIEDLKKYLEEQQ